MLRNINSINGVVLNLKMRNLKGISGKLGVGNTTKNKDEEKAMKVEFGELVILEAKQVDPKPVEGTEAIEKYILFDTSTKRFVFVAPCTQEGLESVENVKNVKEKDRQTSRTEDK